MTSDLYEMMQDWLKNGNDLQVRHAENRLSLPDAVEYYSQHAVHNDYPPMREQLGNAVSAISLVYSKAIAGHAIRVDRTERDRRLAICRSCEWFDSAQGRCKKCGCVGRFKTWLRTETCPIEKW